MQCAIIDNASLRAGFLFLPGLRARAHLDAK